jgi:POT family proton-dependent oligopeptide transporter
MTWFQSLNPLLVMADDADAAGRLEAAAPTGQGAPPAQRMATGALIVAGGLPAAVRRRRLQRGKAHWLWLVLFFGSTPSASSSSCRRAWACSRAWRRAGFGATTVAAWYLTIFAGSLSAGLVGTLWSRMSHTLFRLLAGMATVAAILLLTDRSLGEGRSERLTE